MNEKRFTLRLDGELFERISQKAVKNHRSIAKEIKYAVSQYLSGGVVDSKNDRVQYTLQMPQKYYNAIKADADAIGTTMSDVILRIFAEHYGYITRSNNATFVTEDLN